MKEQTREQERAILAVDDMLAVAKRDHDRIQATPDPGYEGWRLKQLREAGLAEAHERMEGAEALLEQIRLGVPSLAAMRVKYDAIAKAFREQMAVYTAVNAAHSLWTKLASAGTIEAVLDAAGESVTPTRDDARAAEELGIALETDA